MEASIIEIPDKLLFIYLFIYFLIYLFVNLIKVNIDKKDTVYRNTYKIAY